MARPSARNAMLEGALRAVEAEGIDALTIDSAAAAAGVTRRGLMYHFPTKDDLLAGLHQFLADRTERALLAALGEDPSKADHLARTTAYVTMFKDAPTRADLQLIISAKGNPRWLGPWRSLRHRWFPEDAAAGESTSPLDTRLLLARATVDGLWSYQVVTGDACGDGEHERLVDELLSGLDDLRERHAYAANPREVTER